MGAILKQLWSGQGVVGKGVRVKHSFASAK